MKLILRIPFLPPSINAAYKVNRKTGALYLDSKAKSFKEGCVKHLTEHYLKEIHSFKTDEIYKASYYFHFLRENLINGRFGRDKRIKSLYKAVDADNRQKIMQDAVSSAFGFNDSHIFASDIQKRVADKEFTVIVLEQAQLKDYEGEIDV